MDAASGKVTVRGVGFDVEKLRVKVSNGCRKHVEFIPPPKELVTEIKTKKEVNNSLSENHLLYEVRCSIRAIALNLKLLILPESGYKISIIPFRS